MQNKVITVYLIFPRGFVVSYSYVEKVLKGQIMLTYNVQLQNLTEEVIREIYNNTYLTYYYWTASPSDIIGFSKQF